MYIASVSSIPGRLSSLMNVLERFKSQTRVVDKILITIAKYYPRLKKEYPEEDVKVLETYLSSYPIPNQVMYVDVDIGPSVKLTVPLQYLEADHGVLDTDCEDVIIIFDDDSVFYERGVELLSEAQKNDPDGVYGLMGVIEAGDPTKPQFVHGEFVHYPFIDVDVLGGYRGVLYPVKHLVHENNGANRMGLVDWVHLFIEAHQQKNLIAMHDDHIFAYYCKYRGIPKRVVRIPEANGRLFYEPIGNTDGIFADTNSETSYKMIQEIVSKYTTI